MDETRGDVLRLTREEGLSAAIHTEGANLLGENQLKRLEGQIQALGLAIHDDTIYVTDTGETMTKGRLRSLNGETLVVETGNGLRSFNQQDIHYIYRERPDSIVTGASEKGTWVRLLSIPVEGKVVAGFQGMDVGDRERVQLIDTDVERGFIDFKRARSSRHG